MGLLTDLLLLPITGPVRGLLFITEQIRDQVDKERLSSSQNIQDELMRLTIRHEFGELSDEAYTEQESALIERLDELLGQQEIWQEAEEIEGEIDETAIEPETIEYTQNNDAS